MDVKNRWIVVGRKAGDIYLGELMSPREDGRLAVRWDGFHPDDPEVIRVEHEVDPALFGRWVAANLEYERRLETARVLEGTG
jgi:hypothetical protein